MTLRLEVITVVSCDFCGYRRTLTLSEAANWMMGEHAGGSQGCPSCCDGFNCEWTAAQGRPIERSVMV